MAENEETMETVRQLWKQISAKIARHETDTLLQDIQRAADLAWSAEAYTDQVGTLIGYIDIVSKSHGRHAAYGLLDQAEKLVKEHKGNVRMPRFTDTLTSTGQAEPGIETVTIDASSNPLHHDSQAVQDYWMKLISELRQSVAAGQSMSR